MRGHKEFIFKDTKKLLKILLINPFGIGDVIFSTPLIGILKENFPHSQVYYICNKRTSSVIEKCPELEGIFIFEKGDYKELWKKDKLSCIKEFISFIKRIKKEKFDLAVDMSMGHQYSFFLKLLNVPERIGFDYKKRGRFLTRRLKFDGFNDKPIGEYYKDILRLAGLNLGDRPTRVWWADEDKDYIDKFLKREKLKESDIIIGIAPGGGVSFGPDKLIFKRWPPEKFAKLTEALIKDADSKVILMWGPGEEDLIRKMIGRMDVRPIISPKTTIRQLAALMARCDCLVCNDSGPLHVAVAAGAKTVSIFGPSDQNVYGPYPKNNRHLIITKDIECRPCYKRFKHPDCKTLDCLNKLEAKDVSLAVGNHLKSFERERC